MSHEENNRDSILKWLRLHLTDQVGAVTFARLLEHFGNIDNVLAATSGQLTLVPRIGHKKAELIAAARDDADPEAELRRAEKFGVRVITLECEEYPRLLRKIHDPPPVLYVKGALTRQDQLAIAMVGSRSCSQYGGEQASRLAHLLAAAGFTIVSGLARGIDAAAHRGALAGQGRTIAVQGRGLADVFPPENRKLAAEIAEQGAVISEFGMDYEPLQRTFPARNRIISGLSLGTIVVEAGSGSGALITANAAMDQNREVMAVPGRVDGPGARGPHRLIKQGAKLVENIEDVIDALGYIGRSIESHAGAAGAEAVERVEQPSLFNAEQTPLSENEATVFHALNHEPLHIDQLIQMNNVSAGRVNAALTSLQLKGLIRQLPGSFYQRRVPAKQ